MCHNHSTVWRLVIRTWIVFTCAVVNPGLAAPPIMVAPPPQQGSPAPVTTPWPHGGDGDFSHPDQTMTPSWSTDTGSKPSVQAAPPSGPPAPAPKFTPIYKCKKADGDSYQDKPCKNAPSAPYRTQGNPDIPVY